jgi:hypothetical protein
MLNGNSNPLKTILWFLFLVRTPAGTIALSCSDAFSSEQDYPELFCKVSPVAAPRSDLTLMESARRMERVKSTHGPTISLPNILIIQGLRGASRSDSSIMDLSSSLRQTRRTAHYRTCPKLLSASLRLPIRESPYGRNSRRDTSLVSTEPSHERRVGH